jgi:hypothetical protein
MRRYLLPMLVVAVALAYASNAQAFFGMGGCGCEPSCGYAEPACGCAAEPSCGCEMACDSCCDSGKHRCGLFARLRARMAAKHSCGCEPACGCEASCGYAEASCGCAAEPACGCAEPSCGCEADCCEPACKRCCIFSRIKARRAKHACCAPACGCEASCGCAVEPSCGCAM